MESIVEIIRIITGLSPDRLFGIVAICGIGLAAFTVYVVHSIAKDRDRGHK